MADDVPLSHCRIVLVRTEIAGNIGATARAMRNFGPRQLVLVDPKADPADREARRMSTHGQTILDSARVVVNLTEAIGDCGFVAGTSARTGGVYRDQSVGSPADVAPRVLAALTHGPAALVFGPEPSGLTNEEVSRCHFLIHIPAEPEYPSLNLAQAVTVCLYELRRQWLADSKPPSADSPAPFVEQDRMFEHLRRGLEAVHFVYGDKADALMHAVRHLIGRAGPSPMEVGILHGLARQLEWIAERAKGASDPPPPT